LLNPWTILVIVAHNTYKIYVLINVKSKHLFSRQLPICSQKMGQENRC
jgi:hypothetical protein